MRTSLFAVVLCVPALSQTFPEPPPLIRIIRSPLPEQGISQRYAGGSTLSVFGMSTMTGPNETWLLEAHGSFTGLEQTDRALRPLGSGRGVAGENLAGTFEPAVAWVAVYRPWLSYRPVEASQLLGRMRYAQALIFQVNPSAEDDFMAVVRARRASLDVLNLDRPEMVYQIVSGARTITYVFLAPLASLKSFDEGLARLPPYARADAKTAAAANLSHEHFLLRVEPALSLVPDQLAESDPDFWRPRRGR